MPRTGHDIPSCAMPDKEKRQFLSEEKNQKTFVRNAGPRLMSHGHNVRAAAVIKVFWFFSSEKNCFLLNLLIFPDFRCERTFKVLHAIPFGQRVEHSACYFRPVVRSDDDGVT